MLTAKYIGSESDVAKILTKQALLTRRQLFNTAHGRFGFTTRGVQPGDIVCVFHGASTPHVLRRAGQRESQVYQVIGDAYIHGLMHGKIDLEADDIEAEEQDIVLV